MQLALSRRDLLLLALLTFLWGVNWPVMKAGVNDFPPLTFRMIGVIGGVALLFAVARLRSMPLRIPREHWRELFLLGVTNMALWYVLAIYGVSLLSSGRAAILGYTMPVWAALLGFALHGERLDGRTLLGVAAAVVAVALLMSSELSAIAGSPLGALLMLSAAITWAFGTRMMRRRMVQAPLVVLTFWMMVIALVLCIPVAVLLESDRLVRMPNAVEWGAILFNVFLVFGLAQLLWFRLATILPPVASGLSVMLIPVVGLLSGMLLLGETPSWPDYAALGFVIASIATVLLPKRESVPVSGP
jgi:drug/metabolite transporter (DMT)-like permease